MKAKYKTLKAGDVRKEQDQVRHTAKSDYPKNKLCDPTYPSAWELVHLIGWKILPSDLVAAEFRRPI